VKEDVKLAIDQYQAIMYKINLERQLLQEREMSAWHRLHNELDKDRPEHKNPVHPYFDL